MAGISIRGPTGTLAAVTSSSSQIVGQNTNRNGIIFWNCSNSVTVFLVPSNLAATLNGGVVLLPQGEFRLLPPGQQSLGGSWNAICSSSASVLVLEFFDG